MGKFLKCALIALLLCLLHLLVIHGFLTLQELKSHICRTEVARHTHEVGVLGTIAIYDVVLVSLTNTCDADGKPCIRRCGVTSHDIHVPFVAGNSQSTIERLDVFHRKPLAYGKRHRHLPRCSIHGEDVADVHHRRLISEMLHVDICKVEVHSLHKHVGSHQHLLVLIFEHSTVVAHSIHRRGILWLAVLCQSVDKTKFS